MKHLQCDKERIIEGSLGCESLLKHLEATKAPKTVFLSEDASGIVAKVVFDVKSNQLVGVLLPLSEKTGMPKTLLFKAESAEQIREILEIRKPEMVYIVVAQPLAVNAVPFILQIFGSVNKFTARDVLNRWEHSIKELDK